jgi:hypothetical protein
MELLGGETVIDMNENIAPMPDNGDFNYENKRR